MTDIPASLALALGCLVGGLVYAPVKRWLTTLWGTLSDPARRARSGRGSSLKLLLIFATMHPAPWLLLIGLPYAVYVLWNDPLRWMWCCVLLGALLAAAVCAVFESWTARRRAARG